MLILILIINLFSYHSPGTAAKTDETALAVPEVVAAALAVPEAVLALALAVASATLTVTLALTRPA